MMGCCPIASWTTRWAPRRTLPACWLHRHQPGAASRAYRGLLQPCAPRRCNGRTLGRGVPTTYAFDLARQGRLRPSRTAPDRCSRQPLKLTLFLLFDDEKAYRRALQSPVLEPGAVPLAGGKGLSSYPAVDQGLRLSPQALGHSLR